MERDHDEIINISRNGSTSDTPSVVEVGEFWAQRPVSAEAIEELTEALERGYPKAVDEPEPTPVNCLQCSRVNTDAVCDKTDCGGPYGNDDVPCSGHAGHSDADVRLAAIVLSEAGFEGGKIPESLIKKLKAELDTVLDG